MNFTLLTYLIQTSPYKYEYTLTHTITEVRTYTILCTLSTNIQINVVYHEHMRRFYSLSLTILLISLVNYIKI